MPEKATKQLVEVRDIRPVPEKGEIFFQGTWDAADDAGQYGHITRLRLNNFCLKVDLRYGFDNVVNFLTEYSTTPELMVLQRQREVLIHRVNYDFNSILVFATPGAMVSFEAFGTVTAVHQGLYLIRLNNPEDMQPLLNLIENYSPTRARKY